MYIIIGSENVPNTPNCTHIISISYTSKQVILHIALGDWGERLSQNPVITVPTTHHSVITTKVPRNCLEGDYHVIWCGHLCQA